MAKTQGITSNERFFRQWWAVKSNGNSFANYQSYSPKQGISDIERTFKAENKGERSITYPTCKGYIDSIVNEVRTNGSFELYTDVETFGFEIPEGVVTLTKKVSNTIQVGNNNIASEIKAQTQSIMQSLQEVTECDENICAVDLGNMDYGTYDFYQTDTFIDEIFSTTEIGKGAMNRNLIFLIGESGVGKSTVVLDYMSKLKTCPLNNPNKNYAYVSVEMMKSDLFFYIEKNPIAKNVPTIPLMSYIIAGRAVQALIDIFLSDKFDFIVLDSFQDLLVKLVQYCGMKPSEAQHMLLNLLIASAEKYGKTIIAIQHMTKGGDYVGSTFLKHSVTAMMECRFEGGERYMMFSKNRRGGDMERMKIFYNYNKENKCIEYDETRFNAQIHSRSISKEEIAKQQFNNINTLLEMQNINDVDNDEEEFIFDSERFDNEFMAQHNDIVIQAVPMNVAVEIQELVEELEN
jgi:hypothetical protein